MNATLVVLGDLGRSPRMILEAATPVPAEVHA